MRQFSFNTMDALHAMGFASNLKMHMPQDDGSPPSASSSPPSPPLDESFDGSAAVTATTTTTPNDALARQQNPSTHSQMPNPIAAITNMLEDSSQLLVDFFALTEIDPATSMCDSDKHKLGKVVHILRQLARPAGSPAAAAFPPVLSSSFSSASVGSSSTTRAINNQQQPLSSWFSSMHHQPQPVTAKRSSIPSWVIVPPGTVVPPGTPAIFATTNTTANPNNPSHSNPAPSPSSTSSQQRTVWTPSQHALLFAEVLKYGCRFRHIYDLHGPNGTESRQLANFTVTQITAKWHRGLARMSAADAAEWTAKAARATEAFDIQRAAQASAVATGKSGKLWSDQEFQYLCEQVAKYGTQFKRIWTEHGPEGTESQVLARFTTTQLQAKWHNAKKLRPELENLVPAAPAMGDEVDGDEGDDDDGSSGLNVPNRWSNAQFEFLCEQVAKYGTQFKLISNLHGANGTESQTLAKFTTTQLQSKWHNTKKLRPELESLVLNVREPTHDDTDADPFALAPSNRWTHEEFQHLCEQIATHGTQFKLIHELHGPNGEQSQTLARFTVTQLATKWHNAKKLKSEAELLAAFPTSAMPKQPVRTAKRSHGVRGMWSSGEIDFLFDQVVAHGGPSGLPKIWELHGPDGTESRRLARFSLKQGRFKWYNELRGSHPRMPEIKRLLAANGVAGDGGEQGEREADDDMTDDEEENAEDSRGGEAGVSPSKRPRLGDGEMASESVQLEKSGEGDASLK